LGSNIVAGGKLKFIGVEEIKNNIAKATGIDISRVNVKAKTNEKMGFIGRNEGVAVMAIASIKRSFKK
jgi:2-C-methyl-D-erythritol 2,4-cyclodiphosphate synthase